MEGKKHFIRLLSTAMVLTFAVTAKGQNDEQATAYKQMMATLTMQQNYSHDLVRNLVQMNDLTSDVATCTWSDYGVPDLCASRPMSTNPFIETAWNQLFNGIDRCNQFLTIATGTDAATQQQQAEARLLRALYYSYAIDLWGDVPLRTTAVNNFEETRSTRTDVFRFLMSELNDIAAILPKASEAIYGQLTRGAAQLLLARLYLNSEVYTGQSRWADAKTAALEVINGGYALCPNYEYLFMGDNDTNGAQSEAVLPVVIDGANTENWGNTTYIIASTHSKDMPDFGMTEGWAGVILRPSMLSIFNLTGSSEFYTTSDAIRTAGDDRCMILSNGLAALNEFYDGIRCTKFSNLHADNSSPAHTTHADTDFQLMRLAEAYLIAAEADARQNGGTCTANGLRWLNALRSRAHATTLTTATLDDICDEWGREFYMEGQRRSQLIRFERYNSNAYLWAGKGYRIQNLMPIPATVLNQYTNYTQNPGYEDFSVAPEGLTMNQPAFAGMTVNLKKFQSLQISWSRPTNFSDDDEVTYQLEVATDADFTKFRCLYYDIHDNQADIASTDLYNSLGEAGVADDAETEVYIRVSCHGTAATPVSFTVVRSQVVVLTAPWFLVGADIADGSWNNTENSIGTSMTPLFIKEAYANGTANMTITDYFGGRGFKGIGKPGSWDLQVGQYDNDYYVFNDGGAGNIMLNGYYTINLNSSNQTMQVQALDKTPTEYKKIGITGSFVGWNEDYDMTRISSNSHTWYTILSLNEDSELKFHADGEWDANWGADAFPYGQGIKDAANIPVKKGTWKVFFNDITGHYMFLDAATAKLPNTGAQDPIADGMYLNKEFATIQVTATNPIDISSTGEVQIVQTDDANYLALSLIVDGETACSLSNLSVAADKLKSIANNAREKTVKAENGIRYTTFTALLRGYVSKQGLIAWTESEPFTMTLTEKIDPITVTNYYYIGQMTDWSLDNKSLPMTHESDYVLSFTWTTNGEWFAFMPEVADWSNLIRPSESGASFGEGTFNIGEGSSWYIDSSKGQRTVKMVIDLLTNTYMLTDITETGTFKGDVNSDGKVDIVDVTTTISYILGQKPEGFNASAADVNSDKKVDIVDVTSIIDMILSAK